MNINKLKNQFLPLLSALFLFSSCIKHGGLYKGPEGSEVTEKPLYIYPFAKENKDVTAEITVQVKENVDLREVGLEIPVLKYNKSWLFILSQDDCEHAA